MADGVSAVGLSFKGFCRSPYIAPEFLSHEGAESLWKTCTMKLSNREKDESSSTASTMKRFYREKDEKH